MAKKVNYLSNKNFLQELERSREQGEMTPELANMFILLTERYARRSNFIGYSFNDEMQGEGVLACTRAWTRFDPQKSNNPFAFFTQCVKNAFIQVINKERKMQDIKDGLFADAGMDASWRYQEENSTELYKRLKF